MSITAVCIVGALFSLVAAILSFIFIVPDKKKLNPFFSFLRDLFNFKNLWIEKIFKFFYVLSTCFCVIGGFFMLCYVEETYHYSKYGSYYDSEWKGYYGLILMVAGPIVVRIWYEFIMMAILAVKNIMQINQNVRKITSGDEVASTAPNDQTEEII